MKSAIEGFILTMRNVNLERAFCCYGTKDSFILTMRNVNGRR
ncbi:hypothetical protein AC1_1218 [Clostridium perfringens B str. ATCC 3626]|uniref:Uncharacterized protein n=1 Tax=Clostridium perfringens B str. ATCC 3626 TaxID=451754 RepID=A0AAV3BPI1_CLOPF|nr:hypothetical protein AC1_1218 [Clostridium perfringens B str. ATCC 3626]